ncbi:MAG: hypothetical protein IGQ88_13800 [Gloeomargaritaceae cyanobacterium C42_A2020_066]|nr:hypothetical protein [Gloeomargaritaceae cyanobacterium C42_A2020_066]
MAKLPTHLRELLKERGQRYRPLLEAIHETYMDWIGAGSPAPQESQALSRQQVPYLYAELYRYEDPVMGDVDYYLYPKRNRQRATFTLKVDFNGQTYSLQEDQPGWYCPLGPISGAEIDQGRQYTLVGGSEALQKLILPNRDFWILVAQGDSDTEVSGRTPELGTPFILCCRKSLMGDLNLLRQEQLLRWEDERDLEGVPWVELRQCMVISGAWRGIHLKCKALLDALRPSSKMAIHLSGGLKAPHDTAWLAGYGPQVSVYGFLPKVEITVTRLDDDQEIHHNREMETNGSRLPLNWNQPGSYLIEVRHEGEASEKVVRLISWEDLQARKVPQQDQCTSSAGTHRISGALIQVTQEDVP